MFCPRCHRELPSHYRFCPHDGEAVLERPNTAGVAAQPTQIGDSLLGKRYVIRGFVGRGAIARVYLAEDNETGRPVAVKVLERPYRDRPTDRSRFLREARAVTKIGHPNIVKVLEAGIREGDNAPYLVMEFLFGESLGRYLGREHRMPAAIGLPALRQAASALIAAHDKGIIHRDLKPENLYLIGEPGDPYELKVLDFGLSKIQSSDLTAAGIVIGTPAFMAPEQVLAEASDARTDVYALGMVMYRMFVGCPAFPHSDDVTMLAHQLHSPPLMPRTIARDVDRGIEAVILTAIRKNPAHRYPTMNAFFDDLGRLGSPSHEPNAVPWTPGGEPDAYHPQSKVGEMVAEALKRNLTR
jgi:serine/threonine-protein kinase